MPSHKHNQNFLSQRQKILTYASILCLFAAVGLYFLAGSRAASAFMNAEPDAGVITTPAVKVADTTASGGSAVKFTAAAAPATTVKLMPLGDSITLGWNYYPNTTLPPPGGYRTLLWKKLVQQDGKKIDFVGSLSSGPTDLGDKNHEGHSGERIDQIRAGIDGYLASAKPDIVLLTIGTNDILQSLSLSTAPARLQDLVERICLDRPTAQIVVSTIPPRPGLDTAVNAYNAKIPGIVTATQAKQCNTSYFDMHSKLVATDLASSDNTHPTMAGYDKMAEAWYPFVVNLYNKF